MAPIPIAPEEVAEICVEIHTIETDAANCKTVSHGKT